MRTLRVMPKCSIRSSARPPRSAAPGRLDSPASMVARIVKPDFEVDPRRAAPGAVARFRAAVARFRRAVWRFRGWVGTLVRPAVRGVVARTDARSGAWRRAAARERAPRRNVEAAHRADEGRETRPSKAVLLSVFDPADDGLIDARLRLEVPLAPSEPGASSQDHRAEGVESILLLWIARYLVPSHERTLDDAAYAPRIKGSIAAYPRVSWRCAGPTAEVGARAAMSAPGNVGARKVGARLMLPMGITRVGPRGRSKSSIKPVGRRPRAQGRKVARGRAARSAPGKVGARQGRRPARSAPD